VERNDQKCKSVVGLLVLCAALVVASAFPTIIFINLFDRVVRDLDNRVGIHDVGLTDLSRDRDAVLAQLEDVRDAVRQQVDSLRALSARVDTCQRELGP
jgi:hypothetical protein